jgi:hypothetical protein
MFFRCFGWPSLRKSLFAVRKTTTLNVLLVLPGVIASIAVALRIVSVQQQRNAVICDGDGAVSLNVRLVLPGVIASIAVALRIVSLQQQRNGL